MSDTEEPIIADAEGEVESVEELETEEVDELEPEYENSATEVKLFGKWEFNDINVKDMSLQVSASRCHAMRTCASTLTRNSVGVERRVRSFTRTSYIT